MRPLVGGWRTITRDTVDRQFVVWIAIAKLHQNIYGHGMGGVGLAFAIDQLQPNGQSWQQRAQLLQALADYLKARSQIKQYPAGE